MTAGECGYLLLSSKFGDPDRKPLTTAQMRIVAQRAAYLPLVNSGEELTLEHLLSAGVEKQLAEKILKLLEDTLQLKAYLSKARRAGCTPITRASRAYPLGAASAVGAGSPRLPLGEGQPGYSLHAHRFPGGQPDAPGREPAVCPDGWHPRPRFRAMLWFPAMHGGRILSLRMPVWKRGDMWSVCWRIPSVSIARIRTACT